jgi:hypothetical protein
MKLTHKSDYAERRAKDYPSIEEQMDMLWHGMHEGTIAKVEPFYSKIASIKERYPKVLRTEESK